MKTFEKAISLLLAVLLLAAFPAGALAEGETEEPTGFPAADGEMIDNTTDSSQLPTYSDISDIYGLIENGGAEIAESLISDEAREQFSASLDMIYEYEPVEDSQTAKVLGRVETFLTGGGLNAYLSGGDLLTGSEIGLTSNKTDKLKILGTDANASAWVFVVDKDAMSWFVRGEDGMGIPNALVTISYLSDAGQRITKSVVATAGNTPGIAVFDDLPEEFYGIVDIQAEGYRAVTILDKHMGAGEHFTMVIEESQPDELYIRGVDLAGKDMVNEETDLRLVDMDTGDLALKVLVTKTGNAQFPSSIEIRSDSRDTNVLTISETAAYDFDSNTRVYTASKRWAEQGAGLLQADDTLSVRMGGETVGLEHVTVENAVSTPGAGQTEVPLTSNNLKGNVSDRMGGAGWINLTAQILKVPVTFGVFPDGTMILMASYDITQMDPNTQYKFSSLFEKSWNPRSASELKHPLQVFEKSFWENTEKVKQGQKILESKDKIKCVSNKNYDFSMSFSLFLRSCYNEETDDTYGSGGIMFCGAFSAGVTEYFLFTAGPVVIPAYLGFEGHLKINTSLSVNFFMDRAPTGHDTDAKWKYATDSGIDVNARIEIIAGFSVFGGVGVKGVLGAGAAGFVDFDIATVLGKGKADVFTADPHSFIDVLYGVRVEYFLLLFSGTIKIECLSGAKRLDDSNGEYDLLSEAVEDLVFTPLSLEECAERITPQVSASGTPCDEMFLLEDGGQLESNSRLSTVDSSTYPDNQVQLAATKDYTALFRVAAANGRTDIYYQLQSSKTGDFSSMIYRVRLPEGETRSVSEFVVVPNKTDPDDAGSRNKVYIGAILADSTSSDENERMRSTDVAAIVVDLDQKYTTSSVIASDPSDAGGYVYSAPLPAGREDYCSVVYAATRLVDGNGAEIGSLKELLGAVGTNTSYWLSWGKDGDPAQRSFINLGKNKVYSTGAIAPNEPSYWSVDPLKSSDKYLVVKGYGANGYYEETLRCNFRIDIDGMVDVQDIIDDTVSYDSIITNWQYLNGCSYFVAGDSVYWMNRKTTGSDPSNYEWSVEKVINGSGVLSVDNRYAMITNNNQSAVYLIGVVGDYDVNVEEGTSEKGNNIVKIYTITTDRNWTTDQIECTLHGPLDLNFAPGEVIDCFAAAYNADDCKISGLTIVFSTPNDEESRSSSRIRMWNQNATKGLLVTNVKIPDYRVIQGQPCIEMNITVRNYGYGRENPVSYTICDENGVSLIQVINGQEYTGPFYTGEDLYTGDSRVDRVFIRPNPDWSVNEEHEVVVDIGGSDKYDGDIDAVVNSAKMQADNVTLTAENALTGGRHFISTSITNNTLVGLKAPVLKIVLDYGQSDGEEEELRFALPMRELLYGFDPEDEELIGQVYHYDVDMDDVWKDGLEKGLRGAYVSLVDEDDVQVSNEAIYVLNPAEERTGEAVPAFTKHSLVLSGGIGVNFFMDLPEIDGVEYSESYMEFTIGKNAAVQKDSFDPDHMNATGQYYGFTCHTWTIQMADTITAVFHYGDGKTVQEEYSVAEYIETFEANAGSFDAKTAALIRAMADYGYYAQRYLSKVNGWTIGDKYAEITKHYADSFDYDAVRAATQSKAIVRDLGSSHLKKATYRLQLASDTTIDVFLDLADETALTAAAEFKGQTCTAERQSDGRYKVTIPNVSAHQLGDMIEVAGDADGAFAVKVSVLSYVYDTLTKGTDETAWNCMAAMHAYYAAAMACRGN